MAKVRASDNFNEQRSKFKGSDEWFTPPKVLTPLKEVAPIVLDPFGGPIGFVNARNSWVYPEKDGLKDPWLEGLNIHQPGVIFCNPPFSKKQQFANKWAEEIGKFDTEWGSPPQIFFVALLPSNTEQKFFHQMMANSDLLVFLKGRTSYWQMGPADELVEGESPSFASVLFAWAPYEVPSLFTKNFSLLGTVIKL